MFLSEIWSYLGFKQAIFISNTTELDLFVKIMVLNIDFCKLMQISDE